jgi:hypothetical protein
VVEIVEQAPDVELDDPDVAWPVSRYRPDCATSLTGFDVV